MVIKSILGHEFQDDCLGDMEDMSQKKTKISQTHNNTKMRLILFKKERERLKLSIPETLHMHI